MKLGIDGTYHLGGDSGVSTTVQGHDSEGVPIMSSVGATESGSTSVIWHSCSVSSAASSPLGGRLDCALIR
jgi:hypothetical protein